MRRILVRLGVHARSARLAVALPALLAAAACGDDGPSIFAPARDVAGVWVRYSPPVDDVLDASDAPIVPHDTLFLFPDERGRWSREIPQAAGPTPLRELVDVYLAGDGPLLTLNLQPCLVCLSQVPPPHYELARLGPDRLILRSRFEMDGGRQYYRRVPIVGVVLE